MCLSWRNQYAHFCNQCALTVDQGHWRWHNSNWPHITFYWWSVVTINLSHSEIFNVEEWRALEILVKDHFNTKHTTRHFSCIPISRSSIPPSVPSLPIPLPSHFTQPQPYPKKMNKKLRYRRQNALSIIKTHVSNTISEYNVLCVGQFRLAGGIMFSTCPFVRLSVCPSVRSSVRREIVNVIFWKWMNRF